MIKINKSLFYISMLFACFTSVKANTVSITFVNQVSAFDQQTNPDLMFASLPKIISPGTFIGTDAIKMSYSGAATLVTPGAHFYDANGPFGPGYYDMTCIDPGGYPTIVDTRYGGSATITFVYLAPQASLELFCSCNGTACGTNLSSRSIL